MNVKTRRKAARYIPCITTSTICILFLLTRLRSSSRVTQTLEWYIQSPEHTPPLPTFNDVGDLSTSVKELRDDGYLVPNFIRSYSTGRLHWTELSGVCVSGEDHVRYLNLSSTFERSATAAGLFRVTEPYRLEAITEAELESNGLIKLSGKTLLLQCWRGGKTQPAHFMFGYGKLFGGIVTGQPSTPYDNVVIFQCPVPYRTEFFKTVWEMVFFRGLQKGWYTTSTRFFAANDHSDYNPYFCMESVTYDASVGMLLGSNEPKVLSAWRVEVERVISRELQERARAKIAQTVPTNSHRLERSCESECISNLEVSILQREEGTAKRRFVNLDEVIELVSEYTTNLKIISVHSDMRFRDTLDAFNSFDILLTPHGSHLTNGLFITSNLTSIIEVVATCFNLDWQKNLHEFADYHISQGHQVVNDSLNKDVLRCNDQTVFCSRQNCSLKMKKKMVQSDLIVNLTVLRADIEKSIETRCSCTLKDMNAGV